MSKIFTSLKMSKNKTDRNGNTCENEGILLKISS